MAQETVQITGDAITIAQVEAVARHGCRVELDDGVRPGIDAARRIVAEAAAGTVSVYGVNTGFGSLSHHRIEPDAVREVQRNLIRSHAAGVGDALSREIVRAMMLVLAASLSRGRSGVRVEVIELILAMLNADVTPVVPSRGSVGASGDLAPLAHVSLVLIGEGEASVAGAVHPGGAALERARLAPLTLEAKEGLALINGTHMMTAIGALALADCRRLGDAAIGSAALAVDACRGTDAPFDARLHEARNHPVQARVAEQLRGLLADSAIIKAHREEDSRVQDPYCLRATPQVLGAAFETIDFAGEVFARELGAVTDNPLVFPDGVAAGAPAIISGGNFHGMPLAIALDAFTVALCHIAGIAERRVYWLLKASDAENPVNEYLSPQPGMHSGLMIVQYTAAACCNELQTLAAPASVANISTSAGMEDYNSMGATAAHQARAAIELARNVIAIELLVMTEAMEYQRPLRSGAGIERIYETVRGVVPRLTADRPPAPDIEAIAQLIRQGAFSGG